MYRIYDIITLMRTTYQTPSARPSSRSRGNGQRKNIIIITLIFLLTVGIVIFLLVQIVSKKIVIVPGTISYDDSLTESEKSFLKEKLADYRAPEDITISATTEPASFLANKSSNYIIYDTLLPVTSFYDATSDISADEVEEYTLISASELSPAQKLLSIDGNYYFDDYQNGALYRVLHFSSDNQSDLVDLLSTRHNPRLSKEDILSVTQTGVTALTRRMLNTLNQVGDGAYFAKYVKDFLSSSDLTHISNEVSFANDCSIKDMTLCSDPRMFSAITAIGTDIVELTGNHNNDWGQNANLSTIKMYDDNNMKTFGGGENEDDASVPLNISEKGNNLTLIGINHSTSSKANGQGATMNGPGANIYDAELTKKQIEEAKSNGDFVIVDVQFSECYSYPDEGQEMPECDYPISGQESFFRELIDEGADMVVGTQAHQPQTYELYKDKPIYYGLGNLFFDQVYWPGTERSLILTHYFKDGKLLQTRITPTMYGSTYQPQIMGISEAKQFLNRLIEASPRGK